MPGQDPSDVLPVQHQEMTKAKAHDLAAPPPGRPENGEFAEKLAAAQEGGVCFLCAITLLGQSGFVRGGWSVALAGLALTCISAVSLTVMMFQSRRLDRLGVAPVAHYGLRFPLYVVVALFAAGLGVDAKGPVDPRGLALVVLVGFVIIAFPVFTMQKAMSLISTLTLAAITALGPLFVFLFQLVEGRVDHSPITMTGLLIYFADALLAGCGGAKTPVGEAARR